MKLESTVSGYNVHEQTISVQIEDVRRANNNISKYETIVWIQLINKIYYLRLSILYI